MNKFKFNKFFAALIVGSLNVASFDMASGMLTPDQQNIFNDYVNNLTAEIQNIASVSPNRSTAAANILAFVQSNTGNALNFNDSTSILGALVDFLREERRQAESGEIIKESMLDHINYLITAGNQNLHPLLIDVNAL